jgi:hypothetical protein
LRQEEIQDTESKYGVALRVRSGALALADGVTMPDEFMCAITHEILVDPVRERGGEERGGKGRR